jgi:hypothetical protein
VSLNGQNYVGNEVFTFRRELIVHRDVAMAGPLRTSSNVNLVGQGYRMEGRDTNVKWGVLSTDAISAANVIDYTYGEDEFLNTVVGGKELLAYKSEADSFGRVDSTLVESGLYDNVTKLSAVNEDVGTDGGPAYVEVGLDEEVLYTFDNSATTETWTLYNYNPSSVEFYSYLTPTVQKIHPLAGLTKGGTFVSVVGKDFKYLPEYGVVPHCRFGNSTHGIVVRAHYDSSVRLVCQSPPNLNIAEPLPFDVSLNGVDWVSSGYDFSYYEEPIMEKIEPVMGSVNGGDEVFITGEKFSSHVDTSEFKCRFTPVFLDIPAKLVQAYFVSSTKIKCNAPGGWSEAAKMVVQVTWNGVDFDENNFQYTYYSIHKAHPRSGPSNGRGGDIVISGEGFRQDDEI